MTRNICKFLTFLVCFFSIESKADEIWKESFSVPEKGVWGDADGTTIHEDMEGITQWAIQYTDVILESESDYFKTVSTSGGRFEARDINAEAVWMSEWISIKDYKNMEVSFTVAETGSGNNTTTKYLKAYYKIDDGGEVLFAENGMNEGNFGSAVAKQTGLVGDSLQIVVKISTNYASDKVYLDEIVVSGEKDIQVFGTKISVVKAPARIGRNEDFNITGEIVDDEGRRDINYSGTVYLEGEVDFLSGTLEAPVVNGVCQWDGLSFNQEGSYTFALSTPTDDLAPAYITITVLPPSDLLFFDDYESGFKDSYSPQADWMVSNTEPIADAHSLKHNLEGVSGKSVVFHPFTAHFNEQGLEWQFTLRNGDWDPSSSNKFWFYLATDDTNAETLNGYAVGVNISGTSDILSLWKMEDGEAAHEIIKSTLDWKENMQVQIVVSRSAKGIWGLEYSANDGNWSNSFAGQDTSSFSSNFWGLHFGYTSTRAGMLWLDAVVIRAYDTPPFISNVKVISGDLIEVEFNEPINTNTLDAGNFSLQETGGENVSILSVDIVQGSNKKVQLTISGVTSFELTLTATNITDLKGNTAGSDSCNFSFYPPVMSNDLVINEIMADPSPQVGLPEEDFVELYSRAAYPLQLTNAVLQVGDNERPLGEVTLLPGEYLILCKTGAFEAFSNYGKTLAVTSFPNLKTGGDSVQVKINGKVISQITYTKEWYNDIEKQNGGWSIERIDPERECGQEANWMASTHLTGGTPGTENSVKRDNPDTESPYLLWAVAISNNQVELLFSEPMNMEAILSKQHYSGSDGLGSPETVEAITSKNVILQFASTLVEGKVYQLDFQDISDDCGNLLLDASATIQWVNIYPGDVVINEVLYDPYPEGEDFVELYNNSEKNIPVNRISLASRDEKGELEKVFPLSDEKFIFEPNTYLVCTKSSSKILEFYHSVCQPCFLEMLKFPSYVNKEGVVVLMADSTIIVDEFSYTDDLHSPLLYDTEGISLERISFTSETNKPGSWHSAAEHVGYATPGYQNSQYKEEGTTKEFVFTPKSISPNDDGYNDQLDIIYQLDEPGYLANIWIFDSAGRTVAQLAKNELLGTSGVINWEGEDETGSKLPYGAYIILVEIFDTKGNVKRYKESCILTNIFE